MDKKLTKVDCRVDAAWSREHFGIFKCYFRAPENYETRLHWGSYILNGTDEELWVLIGGFYVEVATFYYG